MGTAQGRLTLWGVEVYLAVAEEGSISAAARRLGVSVSAVSQQLAGIEATLGAALVDRAVRPLGLTPAGQMFRRHAQAMLDAEAGARAELAVADLSGLTVLRLGMIEDFEADVTPRLLTDLAQDLKGCRFLLETGASHRLLDLLEARALDIAVTAEDDAPDDWRERHPLLSDPFVAVVPCDGAKGLPLIRYTARHLMGRQVAAHLARAGTQIDSRFELDSYHAILAMVAAGQGWAILTPLALHHAAQFRGAVRALPLDRAPHPLPPLSRVLSLSARAGVLQDMPAQVATRLRGLIRTQVVAPSLGQWPWLNGALQVL
ncbi:MAG: LysR family transcriptional regulator [Paracoccaceae bacterium]